jgi:GrpB-like predicted nucleotidyltransferase (UPF0157 family)
MIDDEALIGGREKRAIVIVDYDVSWPQRFEHERAHVLAALGARVHAIEHVGSTAVPGLGAKPIVDLLVTVADAEDDELVVLLEAAGYQLRVRERGHRMFRTRAHDVHVHVWASDAPEGQRLLAFRDRLRSSRQDRDRYERFKRELATRDWSDMNAYSDAKGPMIDAILAASPATPPSTL